MADVKRDIYKKNGKIGDSQQKVVFQQKKPLLNYELNLLQDIASGQIKDLSKLSVGTNYSGDSFKVVADPLANPLTAIVKKGIFYHKGYPIVLEDDIILDSFTAATSARKDIVYVEWFMGEISSSIDSSIKDTNIGFETTTQQRIQSVIKISENSDPSPSLETITFNSSQRSITLTNGSFPDWIRIPGIFFSTSSLNNEKNYSNFFEVESSPSPNVLILKTGTILVNEELGYVKFYEKDSLRPDLKQKEFVAYRKNFFVLAEINRSIGTVILSSDIKDERSKNVYNFVKSGCLVSKVTDTSIAVEEGEVFVGEINHYIETGTTFTVGSGLFDNALNFVYINLSGYIQVSLIEPVSYHLMLAEIKVKAGKLYGKEDYTLASVTDLFSIDDVRDFIPLSWNYKFGDEGGTGETGFTTLVLKFKADEAISDRDLVYVSSSNGVSKANSTNGKIPAIGIAAQDIPVSEVNNIVIIGEIENPSWNFTAGDILFVGSGGVVTATPPVQKNSYVQRIGIAVTSRRIFVKPDVLYIKNNVSTGETALISLNANGDLEVIGFDSKVNTDRSSFLAPVATAETGSGSQSFNILEGRYSLNSTDSYYFSGQNINMGPGGNFETSPILSDLYNKAFFTLDDSLTVKMYEGVADALIDSILTPEIPENEMPVCLVTFKGLGNMLAGDIYPINQPDIEDKRPWLNLGNLDNTAFKPVYQNDTEFLVQKGSSWFNGYYISLENNEKITSTTSVVASKYIVYLDLGSASGGTALNSDFVTLLSSIPVDNRRYVPIGEYNSSSSKIVRSTFKAYCSKFWNFREKPYIFEQTFTISAPQSNYTLTNFSFLSSDYLDITINGRQIFEFSDYVKVAPNEIVVNYNVKSGAKVKIRKV